MKAWFVFLINGVKVGTWANNINEARQNMISHYGDIPMEYIGINYHGEKSTAPNVVIKDGMSSVDIGIAFGLMELLVQFRY